MRRFIYIVCICTMVAPLACRKDSTYTSNGTTSIQVINGAINVPIMLRKDGKLNTSGLSGTSITSKVGYGTSAYFYAQDRSISMDILNGTDTTKLFGTDYSFKSSGKYTLLVAGQVTNVDAVLVEETNYPFVSLDKMTTDADSVINIRFVNLSPDVSSIRVFIPGAGSNEVSNLNFKSLSAFKSYVAKVTNTSYKFEFRNAVTNDSLATVTFGVTAANRFKNVALVLRGMKTPGGGQPALGVSVVNYF